MEASYEGGQIPEGGCSAIYGMERNLQQAISCFQVVVNFQNRNKLSAGPKTLQEAGSATFGRVLATYVTPCGEVSEKVSWYSMFRVIQRVLPLHTYCNEERNSLRQTDSRSSDQELAFLRTITP